MELYFIRAREDSSLRKEREPISQTFVSNSEVNRMQWIARIAVNNCELKINNHWKKCIKLLFARFISKIHCKQAFRYNWLSEYIQLAAIAYKIKFLSSSKARDNKFLKCNKNTTSDKVGKMLKPVSIIFS